jgi:hypothetical protein
MRVRKQHMEERRRFSLKHDDLINSAKKIKLNQEE